MYIGIDLGGTNIAVGLVNENKEIIAKKSIPTLKERHYKEIVKDMAEVSKKVVKEAGYDISDIKAVGIGCPGTTDNERGLVLYCNNIAMRNAPLAEEFRKHFDVPVSLINDADAAAYGEYCAIGRKMHSFIFVTLGTGVGGGIIINDKIYSGFNNSGGELGHTTLYVDGKACTCGRNGCLEQYASVTALGEQTKQKMNKHPESLMHEWVKKRGRISGRTAFECAKRGDKAAIEVKEQYIRYVAEGVCNFVNIFQPEMLVIGGGISKEGDELLIPIKKFVKEFDYNKDDPKTEIKIAQLFNDAGIIGAAMATLMK